MTALVNASSPAEPARSDIDWAYLAQHGFDRRCWALRFPLDAPWHNLRSCLHPSCPRPAMTGPGLCYGCHGAFRRSGATDAAHWCASAVPPDGRRLYAGVTCLVGCDRDASARGMCKSCSAESVRVGMSPAEYAATHAPRSGYGPCHVRPCSRRAAYARTRLCEVHARQWARAGSPPLDEWVGAARPAFTGDEEVSLSALRPVVREQVLYGFEHQLRGGGRISPVQVRAAVTWLLMNDATDLRRLDLPTRGSSTTYLRLWRAASEKRGATPDTERRRAEIRLDILHPKHGGRVVNLEDVSEPWLLHLAQEQIWTLAAKGASSSSLVNLGISIRWFSLFLRQTYPESHPRLIGREGMTAFLSWLQHRFHDSQEAASLAAGDPRRSSLERNLLPGQRKRALMMGEQRLYDTVRHVKQLLDDNRDWLVANGAADVYLAAEEVPPWPEPAHLQKSEEQGRSEDALPEFVFLRLMDEQSLSLIPPGNRRNLLELQMRIGRRPWELRHLRFDCLSWGEASIEDPSGTASLLRYPYITYWMEKVGRRHLLPLHETDAEVITRQQAYLRGNFPHWFGADGQPLSEKLLLFPTPRESRANALGTVPVNYTAPHHWIRRWVAQLPELEDEDGLPFPASRIFLYAFRHTYAQLRADAGVPLDVLQVLMGHRESSTTQVYYRPSKARRVDAAQAIAARYRLSVGGDRVALQSQAEADSARIRAGVASVPVPAGACHEMNNVRADGRGCPIFYRCFACRFFSTDFTHLTELRQLRAKKAEHLVALETGYGTVLRKSSLADANITLLREEVRQLDDLVQKCEKDMDSLSDTDRETVESWLASRDRFSVVIPLESLKARQQQVDAPTVDPALISEMAAVGTDGAR